MSAERITNPIFDPQQFAVGVARDFVANPERPVGEFLKSSLADLPDREKTLVPAVIYLYKECLPSGEKSSQLSPEFKSSVARIRGMDRIPLDEKDPLNELQQEYDQIRDKEKYREGLKAAKKFVSEFMNKENAKEKLESEWKKIPEEESRAENGELGELLSKLTECESAMKINKNVCLWNELNNERKSIAHDIIIKIANDPVHPNVVARLFPKLASQYNREQADFARIALQSSFQPKIVEQIESMDDPDDVRVRKVVDKFNATDRAKFSRGNNIEAITEIMRKTCTDYIRLFPYECQIVSGSMRKAALVYVFGERVADEDKS